MAPLRYLSIKHDFKVKVDAWWPLILAIATMAFFAVLPVRPQIFGDAGFLKGVHDLIGLLAAFFVAALAAVSTFDRPSLDMLMVGTPPSLGGRPLTRRQFVCYLFGYLSVLAFALFFASVAAEVIAPTLRLELSQTVLKYARLILGFLYSFAFWNMSCTTLLGIWFLVERVHADDEVIGGDKGRAALRAVSRRDP